MNQSDKIFKFCDLFYDIDQRMFRFVRYSKEKDLIFAWHIIQDGSFSCQSKFMALSPLQTGKSALESLKIWDDISLASKKEIESNLSLIKINNSKKMNLVRSKRKGKEEYKDIPRNIKCSTLDCDNTDYIPPSTFFKKANLGGVQGEIRTKRIEEFIFNYKCSKCSPRQKGKKANPLYAGIPRKTKCASCGKTSTVNIKKLHEEHKGNLKAIKETCNKYLCRNCDPNWGSWLKKPKK